MVFFQHLIHRFLNICSHVTIIWILLECIHIYILAKFHQKILTQISDSSCLSVLIIEFFRKFQNFQNLRKLKKYIRNIIKILKNTKISIIGHGIIGTNFFLKYFIEFFLD
jgi:magnesium-transporting ATPase (P-type)